ncbi:hypothetical protein [Clostridium algidicarnis]|jgi:hypothetical protein|uniref:hypothetical protein n=1 Tax=Clostridium algidicarnis TaxID=37659 RepID=UPI001C0E7981|nr:hypothetical protein [Clostridium algidicarnis]MBU3204978.1 hypothetical protein [Clostridium algidicarnis]MBU3213132.1 hypothetical protein [Clostridium algidicarnis]MBU3223187.1 hypothetical protein [Clostridium algidicarnis]
MSAIIIKEYKELLRQKNEIEQTLPSLPEGYISTKTIKEKQYYYLQNRVDGKITSKYLKENEVDTIKEQVERCKKYKAELPKIEVRLKELEQAAKLIDKSIARHLTLLKLSCGMDSLSNVQKERSASFANALNAIEGVYASKTTQQNIDKWKVGDESFISIFQSTLNMYGFMAEV